MLCRAGQFGYIDRLRFLRFQKTVQFHINIAVDLFIQTPFFGVILFPPRICLPVCPAFGRLIPDPLGQFILVLSQLFPLDMSLICDKHGHHPHSQSHILFVFPVSFHSHINGNLDLDVPFL